MLKLMIEKGVHDSVIPIRWCVEREILEELKKRGAKRPFLLLVILSGINAFQDGSVWVESEEHMLAPLDQMVEYVELRRPGESKIFATIVWDENGYTALWEKYLKRENRIYSSDLASSRTGTFSPPRQSVGKAELAVEVPQELFAKEPPLWEKKWVDLWFETRSRDQCQHRRRRLLAYSVQPSIVLTWLTIILSLRWISVIALLALGYWFDFVSWNPKTWKPLVSFGPLIHPWNKRFGDIIAPVLKNEYKDGGVIVLLAGSAYIFVPIAIAVLLINLCVNLLFFILLPIRKFCAGRFDAAMEFMSAFRYTLADKLFDKAPWPKAKKEESEKVIQARETQLLAIQYERTYEPLLCENVQRVEPIKVAPLRRKIYLIYKGTKAYVCRPFAA